MTGDPKDDRRVDVQVDVGSEGWREKLLHLRNELDRIEEHFRREWEELERQRAELRAEEQHRLEQRRKRAKEQWREWRKLLGVE